MSAGRGPIFTEGNVPDVMEGIFDGPVTTAKNLDLSGAHSRGWAAGQEDLAFFGDAKRFEMMGRAADHRGLSGVREARVLGSDFERIDLPGFMPAVGLVQSDGRREKRRPRLPGKGGRAFGRAWVDWL